MSPALAPRGSRWIVTAGFVCTLLVVGLGTRPPLFLATLEGRIYDLFMRTAPRQPSGAGTAIVEIDEESLARYGQWPWPRHRIAALLEGVRDQGVAAIGVDAIFPEPDRTSPALFARELERDFGVRLPLERLGARADNDHLLAQSLARGPFVLGYAFTFAGERASGDCVLQPLAPGSPGVSRGAGPAPFVAAGVICSLPELARAAGASGFLNVAPDADGTVRRLPLLIEHAGALYPSFALALLLRARGTGEVSLAGSNAHEVELRVGDTVVPLDARGAMLVHYRGRRGGVLRLSAAAVLDGRVPPGALRGRIAIVGAAAAGLRELHATPFDPAFPGPEIHAAALDTLIRGDFLRRPFAVRGLELIAALLLGVATTLLLARGGARLGLPALCGGSALLWGGAWLLFARAGIFASPLVPQGVLAGSFALVTSLRFILSERAAAEFARKLSLTQDVIIQSLAALAETRDNETGGHIQRTRHYVRLLAEALRGHPRFRAFLDPETIEILFKLAPLHDIGKVGVRDFILLKPDRLTATEYEEMKRHTVYGDDTLKMAEEHLGDDSFLKIARDFALTHQEKWDGTGYPQGLAGDQIPIAGRLMAVADVYDALVSRRKYKEPLSHAVASAMIAAGRGTHFDPDVVDAFRDHEEEFSAIATRFADAQPLPFSGETPGF